MSGDFLWRWSQRKAAARRKAERHDPEAAPAAGAAETEPAEPVLAADEIAALPRPDQLTADTDITGFLRPGVPQALRNAALRRVWMLDPAIRDFAGHARDYDYDWNTPGGAPGYGAIEPGDDVAAMVRRILGEAGDKAERRQIAQDAGTTGGPTEPTEGGTPQAQPGPPDTR